MKNSIFKSFRFEIVLYSLLSLLYTLLTLALTYTGIYLLHHQAWYTIRNEGVLFYIGTVFLGILVFIVYFLLVTKKFVDYIKEIAEGINEISSGNLDNRIIIRNGDEFALIANKLNQMADNIKEIMEYERRSENAKNELITSVAHDLRTPLTSIIGYLDLVSTKESSDEIQRKYISIAYNKSKRLEKLIEDLFTYTKFNFGEVKPAYFEVDIVKLINQLLDEFYPSFTESQLEYEFLTENASTVIKADGNLLARAFANLISNAIKYSVEGTSIKLELTLEESEVIISIANCGEIIPEEDLENIFQRFYRVESSRSSETGGSGLGLAIANSIIEMHGGRICAESNTEVTKFMVILPKELNIEMG